LIEAVVLFFLAEIVGISFRLGCLSRSRIINFL
jgi:hypothetical protein